MKFFFVLLFAFFLTACTHGSSFSWDNARKIKEGMTEAELTQLLGPPYRTRTVSNGETLWQWVYVDLYGVSGGTKSLSIPTKEGRVTTPPAIHESFK